MIRRRPSCPVERLQSVPWIRLHSLVRKVSIGSSCMIGNSRADHAYLVVCEHSVGLRQLVLQHMAGDAIARRHFAHRFGRPRLPRILADIVAGQTFGVICSRFANERLVRVVTCDASNANVTFGSPTAALLKAVRLKSNIAEAGPSAGGYHVGPRLMTSPTKIDRRGRRKMRRIHDLRSSPLKIIPRNRCNVSASRSMAGFTCYTRNSFL